MNKFLGCLIIALAICQNISAQLSCGFQVGKAVHLPKPVLSENIKFTKETEIIEVKVEINEQGSVTSAKTVSGNSAFAAISESAALNSKFRPSFPKIKVAGIIKYEFSSNTKLIRVFDLIEYKIKELEEKLGIECAKLYKTYSLRYKAEDSILRIVDRLIQNKKEPNSEEIGFVANGKAQVGIRLVKLESKNLKKLKSLGVRIISRINSENSVVGQIPIEKLELLLESKIVIYVFPFWIKPPPKPVV